jgi:hypothetical protein
MEKRDQEGEGVLHEGFRVSVLGFFGIGLFVSAARSQSPEAWRPQKRDHLTRSVHT